MGEYWRKYRKLTFWEQVNIKTLIVDCTSHCFASLSPKKIVVIHSSCLRMIQHANDCLIKLPSTSVISFIFAVIFFESQRAGKPRMVQTIQVDGSNRQ